VLRMSTAPEFLEVSPEYLLAINASGKVVGYNHLAQKLFKQYTSNEFMGQSISSLMGLTVAGIANYLAERSVD